MSYPDFTQKAEDHCSLLVIVRPVGSQLRQRTFLRVYDRIARLTEVQIPGQQRTIHVRYKANYPVENSEWGDFQAHRKVLGVIGIGRCTNDNELPDLFCKYDDTKQTYANTLFDSRLLVFGLNTDGSTIPADQRRHTLDTPSDENQGKFPSLDSPKQTTTKVQPSNISPTHEQTNGTDDENHNGDAPSPNNNSSPEFQDPLNAREVLNSPSRESSAGGQKEANLSHVIFYPSVEESSDLEDKLRDFVASLFWVLESKRLDRSQERLEKLPLLMTPFEKRDLVGVDTESRVYKKRCQGRLRKHLADLCLLAGLPAEALLHYQTCLDILRSANDWLWLAAAFEGACSASVIVMSPKIEKSSFNRNFSFSVKRGVAAIGDARVKSAGKTMAANGLDLADSRGKTVTLPSDLVDKYREAVASYSKYKNAAIVEMEACIKATKVLIGQQLKM